MKKISTLKKLTLVAACSLMVTISNAQLLVNGPIFNSPGTGAGGTDESWCYDVSFAMGNFGYGASTATFFRQADDFVVPVGQTWNIDSLYLYCYQTNAPATASPITAAFVRIMTDNGGMPGTVLWGDSSTNRLIHTEWTNGYRVLESATGTATTRAIWQNTCSTPALSLPAGTYWLDFQFTGSSAYSGPWANPITITGSATSGNAVSSPSASGAWTAVTDAGSSTPQGFPFSLFGLLTGIEANDIVKNISLYPNPTTNFVNLQIDLNTAMPVGIEISNTLGEIVFSSENGIQTQLNQQIDVSGIAAGFYTMKIKIGSEFVIRKFTKE